MSSPFASKMAWGSGVALFLSAMSAGCGGSSKVSHKDGGGAARSAGGAAGASGSDDDGSVTLPKMPATLDLLFMIDNSSSMADKQELLADAVPILLERLANPNCIDSSTGQAYPRPDGGECTQGGTEFNPVASIHLGIVTSSIGAHGVDAICKDYANDPTSHTNDKGELVTRGATDAVRNAFLDWTPGDSNATSNFQAMLKGVGQHGCGYEAQLEAPYRFLVDPDPPSSVHRANVDGKDVIVVEGTDETILAQRAQFLRPDSLVTVVMVTDENDCSLQEYGQAWQALMPAGTDGQTPLRPGTNKCDENPNDPCCYNCGQEVPPADCPEPDKFTNCVRNGQKVFFQATEDPSNLRCWDQKRRYGVDLLYPIDRYVRGYTQLTVTDRNGKTVANPLFSDLQCPPGTAGCTRQGPRDKSFVFVAGIVGVPWQDIAKDPEDIAFGFKTTSSDFPWDLILGDPMASPPAKPTDPLMIESVDPRSAKSTENPLGSSARPDDDFGDRPDSNPINGHEWDTSKSNPQVRSDLQYACIFELPTPLDCSKQTSDCDCIDYTKGGGFSPKEFMSPLCQDRDGNFGTTQYRAKAYPGVRELRVLQGIGSQAIVASICAATVAGSKTEPSYGYNPAMQTIADRLKEALRPKCLPRPIRPNDDGKYPCIVYEAFDPEDGQCDCTDSSRFPGRSDNATAKEKLPESIRSRSCICQMKQLEGKDKEACQTARNVDQVESAGWCYVDPSDPTQSDPSLSCELVKSCPSTGKRLIRFAGADHSGEPRPFATTAISCEEAAFRTEGGAKGGSSSGGSPCE